jgi:hypothetical protein
MVIKTMRVEKARPGLLKAAVTEVAVGHTVFRRKAPALMGIKAAVASSFSICSKHNVMQTYVKLGCRVHVLLLLTLCLRNCLCLCSCNTPPLQHRGALTRGFCKSTMDQACARHVCERHAGGGAWRPEALLAACINMHAAIRHSAACRPAPIPH